ncbi:MAG: recombinase family protein [Clostridiales bacterium]|nr:recombinase family protein [Clostridiales bacterium]
MSKEDLDKANRGDDSESIQNQKLLLLDYAVSNGFLVHNVYVDDDLSGFSDRPAFKQMIEDAAAGLFNIVLCKSQSRFTRDMELVERYIHGYFVNWGVRFIGLTDNVDTNVKGNKKARQIYGLINEWFSEDLSENIRAVFKKKMEAGQFLGAFACYGYEKDPQNRHKLIIDDEAAKNVREIFALYLEGFGASRIAQILTEKEIPTPTRYKKVKGLNFQNPNNSFCGIWSAGTIGRILKNQAYIGTLVQGREKKVSYKSNKVVIAPREQWIIVKNSHEPIIDEDEFRKVQKIMEGNRRRCGKSSQNAKPHVLAGKVICADCGSNMQRSGVSRDGRTYYLRCKLSAKTGRRDCTPHGIAQERVENAIKSRIRELVDYALSDGGDAAVISQVMAEIGSGKDLRPKLEKQIVALNEKIAQIQKNIALAYADKLNGNIAEEDFLSFKQVFEDEKSAHLQKKERLERELAEAGLRRDALEEISALLHDYKNINNLTHQLVNDFVEVIQIGEKNIETKEQEIVIKWQF